MAIDTLTALPADFYAGDSVSVSADGGEYPSPTWTRKLAFQGPSPFSVTATPEGEGHLFTLTPATTENRIPGVYEWTDIASDGVDRVTIQTGIVWIKPNPESVATSYNRTCLALIRAHIQGRLPSGLQSHSINGSTISKMSLKEAMDLEGLFAARVAAEDAAKLTEGNDANVIRIYFDPR